MKRTIALAAALILSGSALTGCGAGGAAAPGSAAGDTIKIGVNYELSGPVATYGQANVQGIEMAAEEINQAGGVNGKKIELVKYDTKSDAAEATTLATKLMSQDKVVAAIGPATSGNFKAVIPVATRNKVPVISGSATADDVTVGPSGVQAYAFRTCFTDSFQGTAMAKFAGGKLQAKSAAILRDNSSDYAKGLADNFKSTFTSAGGQIVAEEAYTTGTGQTPDFSTLMTRIKAANPDVIYLPGYYAEAGPAIATARQLGLSVPILGGDGFDSPELIKGEASAYSDIYYTNHYSSLDQDPKVAEFIAAFKAKYNTEPNAFNALGYDTMKLVADAAGRAGSPTGEEITKALASTTDFAAVTGTLTIDENHNPVKEIVVIGMTEGVQATAEKVG